MADKQNGTTTAHGKTWPNYEREAFQVEVSGVVDAESMESAEALRAELDQVLSRYGVDVRVEPVLVIYMKPEDREEKEELDRRALAA